VALRSQIKDVTSLKVYNRDPGRPNSCAVGNGDCEQFCFPVQGNFKRCECATGFKVRLLILTLLVFFRASECAGSPANMFCKRLSNN